MSHFVAAGEDDDVLLLSSTENAVLMALRHADSPGALSLRLAKITHGYG
jgi:hypothetical protein